MFSFRPHQASSLAGTEARSNPGREAGSEADVPPVDAMRGTGRTRVDAEAALRASAEAHAPSPGMCPASSGSASSIPSDSSAQGASAGSQADVRPLAAVQGPGRTRVDVAAALRASVEVHALGPSKCLTSSSSAGNTPSDSSVHGASAGSQADVRPLAALRGPGRTRVDAEAALRASAETHAPLQPCMTADIPSKLEAVPMAPQEESCASSSETDSVSGDDAAECVACRTGAPGAVPASEEDAWDQCARRLATFLRPRPTLPAHADDTTQSFTNVKVPIRLPLYACPFKGCTYSTDDEVSFDRHIGSRKGKDPHHKTIADACGQYLDLFDSKDFVHRAVSLVEQAQVPLIGPATTRRALRQLAARYNDETIKAVCCFVCGQLHTTFEGPLPAEQHDSNGIASRPFPQRTIRFVDKAWLSSLEASHPGSLLNNCSYELSRARYENGHYENTQSETNYVCSRWPRPSAGSAEYELQEWCLCLCLGEQVTTRQDAVSPSNSILLFGVTEDVSCANFHQSHGHTDHSQYPFCRVLCDTCQIPICSTCAGGLYKFHAKSQRSTIPMAIANDCFYGYAARLLVEKHVTWLECACASLVWSTILVYYLEEPHGHLMLEEMEGAQARTQVRGNVFSFSLPWEDIEERCQEATRQWQDTCQHAKESITLPLGEDILAALVNVHIVGGSKDLVCHLEGATMRTDVVLALIAELRSSGYPGYAAPCNAEEAVRQRMKEMYVDKYGQGPFVPERVREASEAAFRARLISGASLIHDKRATPAEPAQSLRELEASARPFTLVAARSSASASTVHEEHANILARYQTLDITTGSTMMDQFQPQYLGLSHPFTMPMAVGGYDVPGKPRWRRPTAEQLGAEAEEDRPQLLCTRLRHQKQVEAAIVKLEDMTRGMPRRIEAQFRRHWSYTPSLWNLYFREQVNLGASLGAASHGARSMPQDAVEQDAAMAAADLVKKAASGFYRTQDGRRRSIQGDMSKLRFAEGVTPLQRRLLQDFSFRTKGIAGTQEIRSKIGHVCFWASVVYGNGIFMTISPGERHNYLAIRLSRYRARDPYIAHSSETEAQTPWIGPNRPSLQADHDDVFGIDIPGYNLRRLIQARDPLAVAQSFAVQVRCVLAALLGVRMCPNCPHCAWSDAPCMDGFGSNAELAGGIAGRSDGICGAVECQKSSGSLHLHFWNFIQRAHQHKSLAEIAAMCRPYLSCTSPPPTPSG